MKSTISITHKDLTLIAVAILCFGFAVGLIVNLPAFAQNASVVEEAINNTGEAFEDAGETIDETVVAPITEPEPEQQPAETQEAEVVTVETTTGLLLEDIGATIAAISGLISVVVGIAVHIVDTIRSKSGDKIVSNDMYNKFMDVVAQVRQKDNELRDVYGQFLTYKEQVGATIDVIKSTNPEVASKIEEGQKRVSDELQNKIMPQLGQWQEQANNYYDTLLKKKPVMTKH